MISKNSKYLSGMWLKIIGFKPSGPAAFLLLKLCSTSMILLADIHVLEEILISVIGILFLLYMHGVICLCEGK